MDDFLKFNHSKALKSYRIILGSSVTSAWHFPYKVDAHNTLVFKSCKLVHTILVAGPIGKRWPWCAMYSC